MPRPRIMESASALKEKNRVGCNYCSKSYKNETNLKRHYQEYHKLGGTRSFFVEWLQIHKVDLAVAIARLKEREASANSV